MKWGRKHIIYWANPIPRRRRGLKIFLCILAFLVCKTSYLEAQASVNIKKDSLNRVLRSFTPQKQVETLLNLFEKSSNNKDMLYYVLEANKTSKKHDLNHYQSTDIQLKVANSYLKLMQLIDAQKYYQKVSVQVEDKLIDAKYYRLYIQSQTGLAQVWLKESRYKKSLDLLLSILAKARKAKPKPEQEIANIYKTLGSLYLVQQDSQLATHYYEKALKIYQKQKDKIELAKIYNNLGIAYRHNPEKALDYHLKSIKIKNELGLDLVSSLGNIGGIYLIKKQYKKAETYYQNAKDILESKQDTTRLLQTYYNLANLYLNQKMYAQADTFCSKLYQILPEKKAASAWLDYYRSKGEIAAGLERHQKAYQYQQTYIKLKDSLSLATKKEELDKIKKYYEMEDSQQQYELLQQKHELHKLRLSRIKYAFYVTLICFIALAIASYSIYQSLRRRRVINRELDKKVTTRTQEQQALIESLERANTELDTFLYKASHDLKGPLSTMDGVCNVALLEIEDSKSREFFQMQKKVIHNMQLLIFRIIEIGDIRNHEILKAPLNLLRFTKRMFRSMNRVPGFQNIQYEVDLPPNLHLNTDVEMFDIVLDNIIKNAIQHSQFNDFGQNQPKPLVKIYTETRGDLFKIHISNNGHPIDPEIEPHIFEMFFRGTQDVEGFGLGLYKSKIALEKVAGEVILSQSNQESTIFTIILPESAISYTNYKR